MIQIAGVFVIGVMVFVAMRLGLRNTRLSLRGFFSLYLIALIGVGLVFLGLSGRLHWLFAIVGSLLPFSGSILRWGLRLWRTAAFLKGVRGLFQHVNLGSSQKKSAGQTSEVKTNAIRMVLDHDTGDMAGEVLTGPFAGKRLAELDLESLRSLHDSLVGDQESSQILEAYLDRDHPEWRESDSSQRHAGTNGSFSAEMTEADALEILGLEPEASEQDIKQAHRRIIQKLHPDRGGSTFLASQVNEAKDLLLRRYD